VPSEAESSLSPELLVEVSETGLPLLEASAWAEKDCSILAWMKLLEVSLLE